MQLVQKSSRGKKKKTLNQRDGKFLLIFRDVLLRVFRNKDFLFVFMEKSTVTSSSWKLIFISSLETRGRKNVLKELNKYFQLRRRTNMNLIFPRTRTNHFGLRIKEEIFSMEADFSNFLSVHRGQRGVT